MLLLRKHTYNEVAFGDVTQTYVIKYNHTRQSNYQRSTVKMVISVLDGLTFVPQNILHIQ